MRAAAKRADIKGLAPHDLRRTCARLCHLAGGELEQIQFLLGHVSVETTERYLACKQRLYQAVNDRLGLEDTSWGGDDLQADFWGGSGFHVSDYGLAARHNFWFARHAWG